MKLNRSAPLLLALVATSLVISPACFAKQSDGADTKCGVVSVSVDKEGSRSRDILSQRSDDLLQTALKRDARMNSLDAAVTHYQTRKQKITAQTANAINYMLLDRGTLPSAEAGNVILGEPQKVKSAASAQWQHDLEVDKIHLQIDADMMEIAMGIGTPNHAQGAKLIATALDSLTVLVGKDEAQRTYEIVSAWSENLNVPESTYAQPVWGVTEHQRKVDLVIAASLKSDPLVAQITSGIHKYNHHSKLYTISSRIMNTTFSLASLTPTLVGPAAQVGLFAYIMATGGPEEDKLTNEVYMSKRLESRLRLINDEAQLSLSKYQIGILTHNPALIACSQSLARRISDDQTVLNVLGADATLSDANCASANTTKPVAVVSRTSELK